jgi:hypothetical protein
MRYNFSFKRLSINVEWNLIYFALLHFNDGFWRYVIFDRKHLSCGRMNKNNNLIFTQNFAWAQEISKDNLDSTLTSQFSLFLDIVSEARVHVNIVLRSFFLNNHKIISLWNSSWSWSIMIMVVLAILDLEFKARGHGLKILFWRSCFEYLVLKILFQRSCFKDLVDSVLKILFFIYKYFTGSFNFGYHLHLYVVSVCDPLV